MDLFTRPHTPAMDTEEPEPTLRNILMAVTSCNTSITVLTDEIKGVKAEISFVRQDMQKLRERTSALEGRVSTLENMAPLQRYVRYHGQFSAQHAACLDDLENRLR